MGSIEKMRSQVEIDGKNPNDTTTEGWLYEYMPSTMDLGLRVKWEPEREPDPAPAPR